MSAQSLLSCAETLARMVNQNGCIECGASHRETRLVLAALANDEADVETILASPSVRREELDVAETVHGWTPLMIACIKGFSTIVDLLVAAGADQSLSDHDGWTAKEHAALEGNLKVARLLETPQIEERSTSPANLHSLVQGRVNYRREYSESQIFIYLGPSHTRSDLKPVDLFSQPSHLPTDVDGITGLSVRTRTQGTSNNSFCNILFPLSQKMVNKPLAFSAKEPDEVIIVFEVFRDTPNEEAANQIVGTGFWLLRNLRQGLAPKRESLVRHYTTPLLEKDARACIGTITFSVLVINPFQQVTPMPKASIGFWKESRAYPIIGHRGSGANSTACTELQIGENTFQSFLTAIDRGATGVEFDVQLTKDYSPVIYHDFLVKETGGDIPLYALTSDQFKHLSTSQAPRSDLLSSREQKYLEKRIAEGETPLRSRSHSINSYDNYRSQDLLGRIKWTEEGLLGNFKGNIRGCAIQESSTMLEQLLVDLPESIPFDLEIKYPMLWEAEDRNMEHFAIELNFYVDTILAMIFRHCRNRNISLSSFSPEICIALTCKQNSFPILLISKAGSVPVSDPRVVSLKSGIEFASAWGLAGIVMLSDPFVMCPRLLKCTKELGLVVCSYGPLNNKPECVSIQINAGLDAIITDKAHLISQNLAKSAL